MKSMKMSLIALSVLSAAACSSGSSGKSGGGTPANTPVDVTLHKMSDCPSATAGEVSYFAEAAREDGGESRKTIKVTLKEFGVELYDTENAFEIDGKSHAFEGAEPGVTYVGVCSKGSIIIDGYQNGAMGVKITYAFDKAAKRLVTTFQEQGKAVQAEAWILR